MHIHRKHIINVAHKYNTKMINSQSHVVFVEPLKRWSVCLFGFFRRRVFFVNDLDLGITKSSNTHLSHSHSKSILEEIR